MNELKTELQNISNRTSNDNKSLFLIKVKGESMINAGINSGDYLLVDKSLPKENNSIVIAEINGNWTVKRIVFDEIGITLIPENPIYSHLKISKQDNFKIIGTVTKVIKSFN
jgi:DNA polymerase V